MTGRINFEVALGGSRSPRHARRRDGVPARILVLGDFGGQAAGDEGQRIDLSGRRATLVDLDTFDAVFAAMRPRAVVAQREARNPVTMEFSSLDDFHPDQIFGGLEAFAALRTSRTRLKDPTTFAEEAGALLRAGGGPGTGGESRVADD